MNEYAAQGPAGPMSGPAGSDRASGFGPVRAGLFLSLLMALYVLSYIDRSIISLLIQPIKRDLQLSDLEISLLMGAAFSIFYATMGLPLSYVADRWSRRNLIGIGVGLWSLMTALGGAAQNYSVLLGSRMGVGLGEAALAPAAYSLIADIYPREKLARALAMFALSASVGGGVALVLGGLVVKFLAETDHVVLPIVGATPSWRAVLIVVGLAGLPMAALVWCFREPDRRGIRAQGKPMPQQRSALAFVRSRWRVFLPLYLGLGCISISYYGMLMWAPTLFLRRFGIATADIALQLGLVVGSGGVIGMILGGIWADRLMKRGVGDGYLRVLTCSAVLAIPFYVAMPLMPDPALALIMLFFGTVAQGLQSGLPAGSIHLITPNDLRARATAGCFLTTGLMGLGLGPSVVALGTQYLFGEAGIGLAMTLANAIVLPLAAVILFVAIRPFGQFVGLAEAADPGPLAASHPTKSRPDPT